MNSQDEEFTAILKLNEGYVPKLYKDSLGCWTIGVGTLISKDRTLSKEGAAKIVANLINAPFDANSELTEDQAKALMERGLA